jgi:hypothetical protein
MYSCDMAAHFGLTLAVGLRVPREGEREHASGHSDDSVGRRKGLAICVVLFADVSFNIAIRAYVGQRDRRNI